MAMESGGEKVACDMAEANLAAAATGDCRAALHWGADRAPIHRFSFVA
jgi:hypothetical protein